MVAKVFGKCFYTHIWLEFRLTKRFCVVSKKFIDPQDFNESPLFSSMPLFFLRRTAATNKNKLSPTQDQIDALEITYI